MFLCLFTCLFVFPTCFMLYAIFSYVLFLFCSMLMLGLHAHILDIMSMVMPCLDPHVCMHDLCSYAYVYAFICMHAWICVLPCFYAYTHILRCTFPCLHAYFHAYMCRSMLPHACVLGSMFSARFIPSSMCLCPSCHVFVPKPRLCLSCHMLL